MMKCTGFLFVIIFFCSACTRQSNKEIKDGLVILHLSGSPYENGLKHGALMKDEILDITNRWIQIVEENSEQKFTRIRDDFLVSTTFVDTIKKYCPELLEEVNGIADGSGIAYETILTFQMSEELDLLGADMNLGNCTSISINKTDSSNTILAQNMDPPQFLHGTPVLLHLTTPNSNLQSYVFTFPGFIGLNGLNSNAVGITCNGISMLNYSGNGLPVAFMVRKILSMDSEHKAFGVIEKVKTGIPQCFTIGGIAEAKCFECSANELAEFYPFKEHNITLHTNFSIANRDFNNAFIDLLKHYGKTVDSPYYCPRYFLAYDKIESYDYKLNEGNIRAILSSAQPEIEPICNQGTFGCLIMELSENPVLYIAPDRPDSTNFLKFQFDKKAISRW